MNSCLIPNKETKTKQQSLARVLAEEGSIVTQQQLDLAYYILANNRGFSPMYTQDGVTLSKLHRDLTNFFLGDERMAILAKSYIYTKEFVSKYSETYKDGYLVEPDFKKVIEFISGEDFNKVAKDALTSKLNEKSEPTQDQIDEFHQFYKYRLYRYSFNQRFDGLVTFDANEGVMSTIAEQRQKYIQNKLNDDPTANVYDLENEFNDKFLEERLHNVKQSFAKIYNIRFDEDGKAVNPIDDKESDLYKIFQIRCNILNSLDARKESPSQIETILNIVYTSVTNGDIRSIGNTILDSCFKLMEGTDYGAQLLEATGYLKKNKSGKYSESDVSNAMRHLKKELYKGMYKYSQKDVSKISSKFDSFVNWISNLFCRVIYGLGWVCRNTKQLVPSVAGAVAGLYVAPSVMGVVAGVATGAFVGSLLSSYVKEQYKKDFDARIEFNKGIYHMLSAMSMCQYIDRYKTAAPLSDIDKDTISKALTTGDFHTDPLKKALIVVRNNLETQLKALNAKANKNMALDTEMSTLKQLITFCEDAINADLSNREYMSSTFFFNYINTISERLRDSAQFINQFITNINNKDYDRIDVQKLMYIKTDIIGAYSTIISDVLLPNIPNFNISVFEKDGDLSKILENQIFKQLNQVKLNFDIALKLFCDYQVDLYLEETANKSIGKEEARKLKENFAMWFRSDIHNLASLPVQSKIMAARTSLSPVVRMVHQRLEEIQKQIEDESNLASAILEKIRTDNRTFGSRVNLFNPLTKYCERDSDGKFTGNFVSETNYGQYMSDLRKERQFLFEKYGIISYRGKPQFLGTETMTPEEQWEKYNTDLTKWMGGAVRDKDGNYSDLTSDTKPRIHRRFKPQYYIDKIKILGKEGTEILENINRDIAEIQKGCITEISYVNSEGETVTAKIPIISKLSSEARIKLRQFMNRKSLLSSSYFFKTDPSGEKITSVEEKSEHEKQIALRFFQWDIKKKEYYEEGKKLGLTKKDNIYSHVIKFYEDQINNPSTDSVTANKLKKELKQFKKDSTITTFSDKIMNRIGNTTKIEYDMSNEKVIELFQLRGTRNAIRKFIQSTNSKRTSDLSKIGPGFETTQDFIATRDLWKQLTQLDQKINDLYSQIEDSAIHKEKTKEKKESRSTYLDRDYVPVLDDAGEDTNKSFLSYLLSLSCNTGTEILKFKDSILKYRENPRDPFSKSHYSSLLRREVPNKRAYDQLGDDLYEDKPTGIFSDSVSSMMNDDFDNGSEDYVQVNKHFEQNGKRVYDNSKSFDKIKNDPTYNGLLQLTRAAWDNYGVTPKNRYQLPQRQASTKDLFSRSFIQGGNVWSNIKTATKLLGQDFSHYDRRGFEDVDNVITSADGTIVDTIPIRWVNSVEGNTIDIDLISSVSDLYQESLKYKYRSEIAPLMEAIHFSLTGGYSGKQMSQSQSNAVRDEIQRAIYGRTTTGFGTGGRMDSTDEWLASLSKATRSVLHKRLMSHNWASVIKNGLDSFCNLLTAAFVGKYVLTRNVIKGIFRLFQEAPSQLVGMNRSKATNMTQALMQFNGVQGTVHERYSGQHKYSLTRLVEGFGSIEYNFVDYTTKAIITEAVYDNTRWMFNPNKNRYEFLNEQEAELAYVSAGRRREDGYKEWLDSKITIRDMYEQHESGALKLKDGDFEYFDYNGKLIKQNVLDAVRPKSEISIFDDKRSRTLETRIMTTIKQMSSTINGMLDESDKSAFVRNYVGALIFSFRGYLVSQSGEFFKQGTDFYNWDNDLEVRVGIKGFFDKFTDPIRQRKVGTLPFSADYDGQYNFATGTIDKGLFLGIISNLRRNFGHFLQILLVIPEFSSKQRFAHLREMSTHDLFQLKNLAAAVHFFAFTIAMSAYTLASYLDGDGDDDEEKAMKSLVYSSVLASIVERFPQLGAAPFLLGAADIINALTVGVSLMDDAHFLIDCAKDLIEFTQEIIDGHDPWKDVIKSDTETFGFLLNGSYKGRTRFQRNIAEAISYLDFDALPYLFALNVIGDFLPDDGEWKAFKEEDFTKYHKNWYKSHSEQSNVSRARWYGSQLINKLLSGPLDSIGAPITLKPKEKKKGGSGRIIKSKGRSKQVRNG